MASARSDNNKLLLYSVHEIQHTESIFESVRVELDHRFFFLIFFLKPFVSTVHLHTFDQRASLFLEYINGGSNNGNQHDTRTEHAHFRNYLGAPYCVCGAAPFVYDVSCVMCVDVIFFTHDFPLVLAFLCASFSANRSIFELVEKVARGVFGGTPLKRPLRLIEGGFPHTNWGHKINMIADRWSRLTSLWADCCCFSL